MNYLLAMYVRFLTAIKSEKGQTLVEYALLLVLIAIVVILMLIRAVRVRRGVRP